MTEEARGEVEARAQREALLDRYVAEVEAEARASEERALEYAAQARERLNAAFSAGAPLETVVDIEVWDAAEARAVWVPAGRMVVVAEDEGDIILGRLTDNSHSLGVVFEEAERWAPRKYFLPLASLCNAARVRILDPTAADVRTRLPAWAQARSAARGGDATGQEAGVADALGRIEALAELDERAMLPRGTLLVLTRGATAFDPAAEDEVTLAPGTRARVTAAAGDFRSDDAPAAPTIEIEVDGRALRLGFDAVAGLKPGEEIQTPTRQRQVEAEGLERRAALRRMVGFGLGAACLVLDGGLWAMAARTGATEDPETRQRLFAALVPEVALVYGYFSAGGRYWYELRGRLMDLQAAGCLEAARELGQVLSQIGALSQRAWATYEQQFYRRVHVGWREVEQYTTDSKGNRRKVASRWERQYRMVWCEPGDLERLRPRLNAASSDNAARAERGQRLTNERLFQLLETPPERAEQDFALHRRDVGFGRDAAISALVGALCVMPPAFMDDVVAFAAGRRPREGFVPYQQNVLTLAGAVGGIVLAERHRKRVDAQLSQNKYALGRSLEGLLGRLPTLPFGAAWEAYFGAPPHDALPEALRREADDARDVMSEARSFTFVYGIGLDNGRPLTPTHIDAEPVRAAYAHVARSLPALANTLERLLEDPEVCERLTPVLRNAIGTDALDAQMREDQGEATGAAWTQSLWFAAPVWGAALLDAATKLRG